MSEICSSYALQLRSLVSLEPSVDILVRVCQCRILVNILESSDDNFYDSKDLEKYFLGELNWAGEDCYTRSYCFRGLSTIPKGETSVFREALETIRLVDGTNSHSVRCQTVNCFATSSSDVILISLFYILLEGKVVLEEEDLLMQVLGELSTGLSRGEPIRIVCDRLIVLRSSFLC